MEEENNEKKEDNFSNIESNDSNENHEKENSDKPEEQKPIVSMGASPVHTPDVKIKDTQQLMKKMRKNPWMLSTLVLGIVAILLIFFGNFSGGVTGNVVSSDVVGDNLVTYLNTVAEETVTLIDVVDDGSMYLVTVKYQEETIPIYVTKDGEYYTPSLIPLTGQAISSDTTSTEIPKSDKPILEAIVTPYCPYGLQYMKGLLPVYELMKDKADISILSLGVTHMENEELETQRQICIEQEYDKDTLFAYIEKMVYDKDTEICYNDYHSEEHAQDVAYFDECVAPVISSIFQTLSIDEAKVNSCMEEDGETLYNEAVSYARSKGAGGSPSPFLNDAKLSAGRSPEAIKTALCSAFNEIPEECLTTLSEETPAPGITSASGSSTSTTASC